MDVDVDVSSLVSSLGDRGVERQAQRDPQAGRDK